VEGLPQVPQVADLVERVKLDERIVYFPVRHHSPACAWHVGRLIHDLKPDAVLVEGPRDATSLIPMILHAKTRLPIAIYTTYVQRRKDDIPLRYAAYYPMCEYSPEYAALKAGAEVGADCKFIDFKFPEMVHAEDKEPGGKAVSLLDEHYLQHSAVLKGVCEKIGVRDHDDLWDHLYEVSYKQLDTETFMRNVLAYCSLGREDYTEEMLEAEGCLAREQAMAHAIAQETGRVVVVTGGFHTAALPDMKPRMPKAMKVAQDDAMVVLMRYGFEQLDRLNGYASGIPSPEFYQRGWEGSDPQNLIIELGRELRRKNNEVSTADSIGALDHAHRLAQLRGHPEMSREDLLDGVRSAFIKGSEDVEGVLILAHARKMLAGSRIGDLPAEAGQPPIITDFRSTAGRLGIDIGSVDAKEVTLDLYRNRKHREVSRFFQRLRFLNVEFGENVRGPDFVSGEGLERIQEVWRYHWAPRHEAALIERSLYGSTLEEAAAALLLEQFAEAEKQGQGRRADLAARLLLEACRMGLHRQSQMLLDRTTGVVNEDGSFPSVVSAFESVLVLNVSREPLEAHHLEGVPELAELLYARACYLLPELAATPDEELNGVLNSLNALQQSVQTLGDDSDRQGLRWQHLRTLSGSADGNPVIRGAATGLLFGDGQIYPEKLADQLAASFHSDHQEGAAGAGYLRGLLSTARSVLWQIPEVVSEIHGVLANWDEARFVNQLPHMRLALADLTPRECDHVARTVGANLCAGTFEAHRDHQFSEADLLRSVELNKHVTESLTKDGLGSFIAG